MYFTFNQGNVISWDPKVGVDRANNSTYVMADPTLLSTLSQAISSQEPSPTLPSLNSSSTPKSAPEFELVAVMPYNGTIAIVCKRRFKI